jgi:hypothetical protein
VFPEKRKGQQGVRLHLACILNEGYPQRSFGS